MRIVWANSGSLKNRSRRLRSAEDSSALATPCTQLHNRVFAADRSASRQARLIGPDAPRDEPELSNRLPQAASDKIHVINRITRITTTSSLPADFWLGRFLTAGPSMSELCKAGKGERDHIRDGPPITLHRCTVSGAAPAPRLGPTLLLYHLGTAKPDRARPSPREGALQWPATNPPLICGNGSKATNSTARPPRLGRGPRVRLEVEYP